MLSNKVFSCRQFESMLYNDKKTCEDTIDSYFESDKELCLKIVEQFELNLINDVWVNYVDCDSFNASKKRRLRIQGIRFIELVNFYTHVEHFCHGNHVNSEDIYRLIDIFDAN